MPGIVDKVQSNESTYNIRDTETNQTLTTLYSEYNSTVQDLEILNTYAYDSFNTLNNSINDVNSNLTDQIIQLNSDTRNYYDPQITDIVATDLSQSSAINTLETRCDNFDTSISALSALVAATSRLSMLSQSEYEELESKSQVDNNTLYIIWHPNKLERLYYQGNRMDVIPYEAADFLITYLQNAGYWSPNIESFEFVSDSIEETIIKIDGNSHTNAYIDISDSENIKIYAESNHFDISDFNRYFQGYPSLTNANLSSVRNVSNFSNTFAECTALTTVQTPQSAQVSDWSYAFINCQLIDTVHCSGTNLNNTFAFCQNLKNIYIDSNSEITDANYLIAIRGDEDPGTRIVNFYVNSQQYDNFVTIMQDENSWIFGDPYNKLDPEKWEPLPDDSGIKYEDTGGDKLVTIYKI